MRVRTTYASSVDDQPTIDAELRERAQQVASRAYAPYSNFSVGAAGRVDDGRIVVGCNVENASYGLALCAECGLVSEFVSTGGGRLLEVVTVGPDGECIAPCGRCRQVLFEHGGAEMVVNGRPLSELLPDAFGPDDLA